MAQINGFSTIKCVASNARSSISDHDTYDVDDGIAQEGDLVLVEAVGDSGAYNEIENIQGRSMKIFDGQKFIGVIGNRESSKNIVGGVPNEGIKISMNTELSLLTNGGIIGECYDSPSYLGNTLKVKCLGLLEKNGKKINTIEKLDNYPVSIKNSPPIILVSGTATDAGKTTLSTKLISTLSKKGVKVGSLKLAGTGCLEDILLHKDAGANYSLDFPDVGLPSTYTSSENYKKGIRVLIEKMKNEDPDIIVAELGGDIIWANIPTLFQMKDIMNYVIGIALISSDAISTIAAYDFLQKWEVDKKIFIFNSPFKNLLASRKRIDFYLNVNSYDSNNYTDINKVLNEILPSHYKKE